MNNDHHNDDDNMAIEIFLATICDLVERFIPSNDLNHPWAGTCSCFHISLRKANMVEGTTGAHASFNHSAIGAEKNGLGREDVETLCWVTCKSNK